MSQVAAAHLSSLYEEAFERFQYACLWSKKPVENPTSTHARIIAGSLRSEGGRSAYELARRIEEACDAVDLVSA
jgi:hypothetical protein